MSTTGTRGCPSGLGCAIAVAVDTGVVDDRVHPAELVDFVTYVAGLRSAGEIANDQSRTAIDESFGGTG